MTDSPNKIRRILTGAFVSSIFGGGMHPHAVAHEISGTRPALFTRVRNFSLPDAPLNQALSHDGKFLAMSGLQSGRIFVLSIDTGDLREIVSPPFYGSKSISWSVDGKEIGLTDGRRLLFASVPEGRVRDIYDNTSSAYLTSPSIFSSDGSLIWFHNFQSLSQNILVALNSRTGSVEVERTLPDIGVREKFVNGSASVQLIRGRPIFNLIISDAHVVNIQNNDFRVGPSYAVTFDPTAPAIVVPPLKFEFDIDRGIDQSGVMRQQITSMNITHDEKYRIVFRESGVVINIKNYDSSKDKSFEVFDISGRRISFFGGLGTVEGNNINGFVVHPKNYWVISTASSMKLSGTRYGGLLTVWDLTSGEAMQRMEMPTGVRNPLISPDGNSILITSGNVVSLLSLS